MVPNASFEMYEVTKEVVQLEEGVGTSSKPWSKGGRQSLVAAPAGPDKRAPVGVSETFAISMSPVPAAGPQISVRLAPAPHTEDKYGNHLWYVS